MDLPTLQAIAARTWGKEDELKALKAELATLDRKITATLAPKREEQDVKEVNRHDQPQQSKRVETLPQSSDAKDSLVAEPGVYYSYKDNCTPPRQRHI